MNKSVIANLDIKDGYVNYDPIILIYLVTNGYFIKPFNILLLNVIVNSIYTHKCSTGSLVVVFGVTIPPSPSKANTRAHNGQRWQIILFLFLKINLGTTYY